MIPVTKSVSPSQLEQNKKDFLAQPGVDKKINSIAKKLGISKEELLHAMGKETAGSFSSSQRNLGDGKAVGLIQFYPDGGKTYKTIGGNQYEITDIETMPVLRQLNLVEDYLEQNFLNKGGEPGELYVSIAYPALIGADDSAKVPATSLDSVAAQNPGWVDANGEITKASISAFGSKPEFVEAYDVESLNNTQRKVFETLKEKVDNSNKSFEEKRSLKDAAYTRAKSLDAKNLLAVKNALDLSVESIDIGIQKDARFKAIEQARGIVNDVNADPSDRLKAKELIDAYDAIPNTGAQFEQKGFFQTALQGFAPEDTSRDAEFDAKRKELTQQIFDFTQGISDPAATTTTATTPTLTDREIAFQAEKNKDLSSIPTLDPVGDSAPELRTAISEEQDKIDAQKDFVDFLQPENAMMSDAFGDVTGGTRKDKFDLTKQKIKDKLPVIGEKTLNVLKGLADNVDKAFFALSAGAGIKNIFEATERDEVAKSHVSPLFKEALLKTRQASDQGMPYAQKQAALKDIAAAYSGAMKNVMAMSGGQRGLALSNAGIADASRVNALVDLAGKNAEIRQKNLDLYAKTAGAYSQQKLSADMNHAELSAKLESNRKNRQANIGLNLFKEATEYSRNYMDMGSFRKAAKTPTVTADPVATENVYTNIDENID